MPAQKNYCPPNEIYTRPNYIHDLGACNFFHSPSNNSLLPYVCFFLFPLSFFLSFLLSLYQGILYWSDNGLLAWCSTGPALVIVAFTWNNESLFHWFKSVFEARKTHISCTHALISFILFFDSRCKNQCKSVVGLQLAYKRKYSTRR